jgi:hypothetical protein
MNSTDASEMETVMGALFDGVLMPLARRMRASGVQAFPLKPDLSLLSYYVRRRHALMARADFVGVSCFDSTDLALRLEALWQRLGRHELAAQAGRFGEAASQAQALLAAEAPEADLSPYLYAMF